MTREKMIEALARAIHCHDGRLPTPWDADMIARWPDDCEYERNLAMSQAAAVLELVGPRRLVWDGDTAKYGQWSYTAYDTYHGDDVLWIFGWSNYPSWEYSSDDGVYFDTLEAAQAAAQAHADASHWANTKIGGE